MKSFETLTSLTRSLLSSCANARKLAEAAHRGGGNIGSTAVDDEADSRGNVRVQARQDEVAKSYTGRDDEEKADGMDHGLRHAH